MPKIMLVEDDPTMQMLLKTLLEMEGYQVIPWDVDTDPIAMMQAENPEVVLLDVNLKGQDGFEVLQKIRADAQLKDCRVVMSSGINYKDESIEKEPYPALSFVMGKVFSGTITAIPSLISYLLPQSGQFKRPSMISSSVSF